MKPTLLRFPLLFAISTLLTLTIGCKKENVMPPGASVSTGPVQYETPFAEIPGTADIVMYEINERASSTSGSGGHYTPSGLDQGFGSKRDLVDADSPQ